MPRLAGRGVLFAALAVPFVLVVAPLTASADVQDNAPPTVTEETATGAVASALTAPTAAKEAVVPAAAKSVVEWPDNDWVGGTSTAVHYEEATAGADSDGAYIESTSSSAGETNNWHGHGTDTMATYNEISAAAGSDGAYVESTSSSAGEIDGWHSGWHDGVTGAAYGTVTAHAGSDGAWVEGTESAAGVLD